jgi:hypothetical protein
MKKLLYAILPVIILLLTESCSKDHQHVSKQYTIDTTLTSGTEYQLNLQPYGDGDDTASISTQATNFTTSEIINVTGIFAPVYHYLAETKAGLADQVVLAVKEGNHGNDGNMHHAASTIITINFTIK